MVFKKAFKEETDGAVTFSGDGELNEVVNGDMDE